jgi:hypothetical protein
MAQLVGGQKGEVIQAIELIDPYLPGDRGNRPILYVY